MIFKNLNGTYMHYSKGCGGPNPWEGIGCCIDLVNALITRILLQYYVYVNSYIICILEMAGERKVYSS